MATETALDRFDAARRVVDEAERDMAADIEAELFGHGIRWARSSQFHELFRAVAPECFKAPASK